MIAAPAALDNKEAFARDVRAGLSKTDQRELPATYLYDAVGSALFEAITHLPEYGLTRADERLIRQNAPSLAELFPQVPLVAELGSGNGRKTRHILRALANRGKVSYYPIDVSETALDKCREELSSVAQVVPLQQTYLDGLCAVAARRKPGQSLLVLFLGSTIGNFNRTEAAGFLHAIRACLSPGDALLLGADLVKAVPQMIVAYDDPIGVTAAFNRNILARINRELGGNFALSQFEHVARYDRDERRIEMHLKSIARQRVIIPAAELDFVIQPNETIWTESSYKFELPELESLARQTGFDVEAQWVDREWPFAENLWRPNTLASGLTRADIGDAPHLKICAVSLDSIHRYRV